MLTSLKKKPNSDTSMVLLQGNSLVLNEILIMGYFDDIFGDPDSFSDGLKEGHDFYMENGYRVMTEKFLTNRGYCCANGCRHCPYWPKAQKGNTNLQNKR